MYFMLGNIALEAIDLTEFSETHAAEFAEHKVLKGKPRLQAMGENLGEISFAVRLHYKAGGVESRYQALLSAKAKQEALALIWGASKYQGDFVITDITSNTLFTDAYGNPLCREMTLSLKEFVGNTAEGILGAALNIGGSSLLGSLLPAGLTEKLSEVKQTVKKGVELYNKGKRALDDVRNVVTQVKTLAKDPQLALAYLPSALSSLGEAIAPFGEITGMQEAFKTASTVLTELSDFSRDAGEVYHGLQAIKQGLNDLKNGDNTGWENWVTVADNTLSDISDTVGIMANQSAKMTAWIVLRSDEEADNE
ncbi:phage tail protein [Actinobacillus suis]|uniref:phage tail protein n=1 Tax=Actinobacillus suis TaxID=716 RepID=UPI000E31DFD3|nr:phage tail protein [Actinobacillus suis]